MEPKRGKKKKVKAHSSQRPKRPERLSRFLLHESCLEVLPLPISMLAVPLYTSGWRETKWSKVPCRRKQCNGQGLNPEPPDLEFEVLTAWPHTPPRKKRSNFAEVLECTFCCHCLLMAYGNTNGTRMAVYFWYFVVSNSVFFHIKFLTVLSWHCDLFS